MNSLSDFDQVRRFWQNPRVAESLAPYDIQSTTAHIEMLSSVGIIDAQSGKAIVEALENTYKDICSGKSFLNADDVDMHAALERHLYQKIGEQALLVRTAKSPNDQIATDIRMWLRNAISEIFQDLIQLRKTLVELAKRDLKVVMPGYTHMQPALPILLSHWWLAHEERYRRDFARLIDLLPRLNQLPLGAGALAGINQPIDRGMVAKALDFESVIENSLDAVSDRDYMVEFGAIACLIGTHISQMSSELLIWTTHEFGFIKLKSGFVFSSVTMPQKRNPAFLELLRSRPSTIIGYLMEFLSELKAIPMGYCQDLLDGFPSLLDMVDNLKFVLELTCAVLPNIEVDAARMKEVASADLVNASSAVDFLISRNIPRDKASEIVESLAHYCQERNKYLSDLGLNEWQQFSPAFDQEIYKYVTMEESVSSRTSLGGTSLEQVSLLLNNASKFIAEDSLKLPKSNESMLRKLKVSK